MKKRSAWLAPFLLIAFFGCFGLFEIGALLGVHPAWMGGQWTIPARGTFDWWALWAVGWVFFGMALIEILLGLMHAFLGHGPRNAALRQWITCLLGVAYFALFLLPFHLWLFSPLGEEEASVGFLFFNFWGSGTHVFHRVLLGLVLLIFDLVELMWIKQAVQQAVAWLRRKELAEKARGCKIPLPDIWE